MKKMLKLMLTVSVSAAVMLASCTEGDLPASPTPPATEDTPVQVELKLKSEQMDTRAIDEDAINDINIYFFGNNINYHFYYPEYAPSFVFEILPGTYTLCVVTNVHKDMGGMTESELIRYKYSVDGMVDDIPMTASMNVSILGAMTLPTLEVTRAAAKIAYTISVDAAVSENIKLRSVQFCNVPRSTVLFGANPSSTDKGEYYDADVVNIDNDKTYSEVFYMLENCQGEVESITDPRDKSPENAPVCATYMRIVAEGADKVLEYTVYLGENSTSNFDVRRNTKHTMNLVIKGENEIDNRVRVYDGLYYGTANCIVYIDTPVTFDVTPYRTSKELNYAYTGIYAGDEYKGISAKLLYSDAKSDPVLTLDNNKLTVRVDEWYPNTGGNIGVAIVDVSGEILWSWHIWHPQSTIKDEEYTNASGEKFQIMHCNLGARSDNAASVGYGGAIYQWGRKDPLWPNNDYRYGDGKTGLFFSTFRGMQKDAVTFEDAIKNPTQFIEADDWFGNDDALWGDPNGRELTTYGWSGEKSVYDPCPEGYRVPNNKTWTGFIKPNSLHDLLVIGSWIYGWHCPKYEGDTVGAWYTQGARAIWWSGEIRRYATNSPLWVSHPGATQGMGERWELTDRTETIWNIDTKRSWACQVRCAKVQ